MSREEFAVLVKGMKAVYAGENFIKDKDAFDMWYALLQDLPYEQASEAAKKYMLSEKFPPTPADIRSKAAEITEQPEMSELEAWALVRNAIKNSGYHANEEFNKLPPECRKAVGSPDNLREWGMLDSDEVSTVIQSHFVRVYRTVIERKKYDAKLPPTMRTAIEEITAPMIEEKPIERKQGTPPPPEIREMINKMIGARK